MLEDELLQSFIGYLRKAGADMGVFAHLLEVKQRHPWVGARPLSSPISGLIAAGVDKLKKLVRRHYAGQLASTVRSLLSVPTDEEGGVIRGVRPNNMASASQPQFSFVDPFRDRGEATSTPDHVLTFVIGGGNYVEEADVRATLQECGWHSVYGTTDMVTPEQFLQQLCHSTQV